MRIEYLDLSHNNFGEESGKILGQAIAENASIKTLNLSWNNIRRKGAIAIAKSLSVILDLNYYICVFSLDLNIFNNYLFKPWITIGRWMLALRNSTLAGMASPKKAQRLFSRRLRKTKSSKSSTYRMNMLSSFFLYLCGFTRLISVHLDWSWKRKETIESQPKALST